MICMVVGARPNFMKMAPVIEEVGRRGLSQLLVHTGQHYDTQMSDVFFRDLEMPQPDIYLGVGSGTHAEQTAKIMLAFEKVCEQKTPELVVVAGDVNSTLACALTAAKLHIPVAHVEAGLRSFDRTMPEETNRVLTDHISELLFTTEPSANENLQREGIDPRKIFFVGNTMIDTLRRHLDKALARRPWDVHHLQEGQYGVITLHRPANVDDGPAIRVLTTALGRLSTFIPLIFPIHPRTLAHGEALWRAIESPNLKLVEPLGYLDFLGLMARARVVITDSGGIQEETTALGVPCITVRPNTERPVTITHGTNRLVPPDVDALLAAALDHRKTGMNSLPELWDGQAAGRIADVLEQWHRDCKGNVFG